MLFNLTFSLLLLSQSTGVTNTPVDTVGTKDAEVKSLTLPETAKPITPEPNSSLTPAGPEANILKKVPGDWYQSTTKLFKYCVDVNFEHPICPQINRGSLSNFDFQSEFFKAPIGSLNSKTLFQATVLYNVGRPPNYWLVGLNLDQKMPKEMDPRLWTEAKYLWARSLFDRREYEKSLKAFDSIVDNYKGKALFHQQRAWVQFFAKKFDKALGSIVSAESPLIYPVPFFEKYFLRALIEKENCLYNEAIQTITVGRKALKESKPDSSKHPWVVLCTEQGLGTTCSRLQSWYREEYDKKIKSSLDDLDLLEIELRDKLTPGQKKKSGSAIVWPYVGENWGDELGYYSVPIESNC